MNTAIIAALAAVLLYVGKKWLDARAENEELRSALALLKRRLKNGTR